MSPRLDKKISPTRALRISSIVITFIMVTCTFSMMSALADSEEMMVTKQVWNGSEWADEIYAPNGGWLVFNITISNSGPYQTDCLHRIRIVDTLPNNLAYIDMWTHIRGPPEMPNPWVEETVEGNTITWKFYDTFHDLYLLPGESLFIEFTVGVIHCGETINFVSATSKNCYGSCVYGEDSVPIHVPCGGSGAIEIGKEADRQLAHVGETITYSYAVTNVGDVVLTNVNVVDDQLGSIPLGITTLSPGDTTYGEQTYTVQESDLPGPIVNIATATGTTPGGTDVSDTATASVDVKDNSYGGDPPIADAGGPYEGSVNESILFDGSNSVDADGMITNYTWDFGDETLGYGNTTTHTYAGAGEYTVTLTVTDDDGENDTDSTTAVITEEDDEGDDGDDDNNDGNDGNPGSGYTGDGGGGNQPPTADANGPYSGFVGFEITVDGTGSMDDGTIVSYAWEFGDGTSGTGETTTHTYTQADNYTITLTVRDDQGATDTDTTFALITDKPNTTPGEPTIEGPTSGNKNTSYSYNVTASDPDGDQISYYLSWDDGTFTISEFFQSGTTYTATHSWTAAGIYTITVHASDDKETSETTTLTVLINTKYIGDIGYIIDYDGDGVYDSFVSNATGVETRVELQEDGTYLIDVDGDDTFDFEYDPEADTLRQYSEAGTTEDGYFMLYLLSLILLVIVLVSIALSYTNGKKKQVAKKRVKKTGK